VGGAWQIHYESNEPRWQKKKPIRLSEDLARDTADNCDVKIIGRVLGAFRFDPRPQNATRGASRALGFGLI
jgi:hypothetical protein